MRDLSENQSQLRYRCHTILAFILLLHTIFFFVYWVAIGRFRLVVDQFVGDMAGLTLPYTVILMVLTAIVGLWSLLRLLRLRLAAHRGTWKPSSKNWVYVAVWLIFIAFIYVTFLLILRENPSQKGVIVHLLNLVRLASDSILFLVAAIWLRQIILSFRKSIQTTAGRRWPYTVGVVMALVLLVVLWLVPALLPPNWVYPGDMPTRPALIAHRGASMLAPENTLGAAETASLYEAFGFETDVRISLDGVPFLMHDDTLARTTNIAEVFPDRITDPVSSFTMDELHQLNAGLWFIQTDPFDTISSGFVSQAQLASNQGQRIPTLSEALALVKDQKMIILFDMRYPPEDHPYFDSFFDIVLDASRESGLNGSVWFIVDDLHLAEVLEEAPQMTRVAGVSGTALPSPALLLEEHYEIVNVDTGILTRDIRAYRQEGLGVNVYTIDEPWLFSQFWLSGVTSVTTNNVHRLSQMDTPFLNMPYARYLLLWGLYGIILAIWLASSQPKREPEAKPEPPADPDLMDFAPDGDGIESALNSAESEPNMDSEAVVLSDDSGGSRSDAEQDDPLASENESPQSVDEPDSGADTGKVADEDEA